MLNWDNLSAWTILIVDDEPDNAEVVATILRFYGVKAWIALNGIEAMEYLKETVPDLVLLDLSMPKMDGWVMHGRVRDDPRLQKLPVVALSAHAMAGDKERVLAAGFDGYLSKPINIPTFLNDIRITLELTKLTRSAETTPKSQGNGSSSSSAAGSIAQPVITNAAPKEVTL